MTPTAAERGRETRGQLLDAAAQLVGEEGWGGVTTRKVAERAGVRPGLVHYHFASVDNLLIDACLAYVERELSGMNQLLANTPDRGTGLAALLEVMASYSSDNPGTTIFSEMLLAATRHQRLRDELARMLRELRHTVADWLARHGDPGEAEATSAVLLAVIDGLILHQLIDPNLHSLPLVVPLRRLAGLPTETGTEPPGQ
ncbi:MAG: TetR/AcrR family transcriptional regulator [Micromonospora sp.]